MSRPMIRKAADLEAAMRANPKLELEHCFGVRDHHWWWLREGGSPSEASVHGMAARALIDRKIVVSVTNRSNWRSHRYALAKP